MGTQWMEDLRIAYDCSGPKRLVLPTQSLLWHEYQVALVALNYLNYLNFPVAIRIRKNTLLTLQHCLNTACLACQ